MMKFKRKINATVIFTKALYCIILGNLFFISIAKDVIAGEGCSLHLMRAKPMDLSQQQTPALTIKDGTVYSVVFTNGKIDIKNLGVAPEDLKFVFDINLSDFNSQPKTLTQHQCDLIPEKEGHIQCPVELSKYPKDCEFYRTYSDVKNKLKLCRPTKNIENLAYYRSIRLIDEKDLEKNKQQIHVPWKIYQPSPKTWLLWEEGNKRREKFSSRIQSNNEFKLTVDDISDLHKSMIDKELAGPLAKIPFLNRFVPKPGIMRSGSDITSGFNPDNWNATQEDRNYLQHYDIVDSAGNPLIQYSGTGKVYYVESRKVELELKSFLIELNDLTNKLKNGEDLPEKFRKQIKGPIDLMAYAQKKFVTIHPFHEGMGRSGRLLQDSISSYFGLPYVPGGMLQNDVMTPLPKYMANTHDAVNKLLNTLVECSDCSNNEPKCVDIYSPPSELPSVTDCPGLPGMVQLDNFKSIISYLNKHDCGRFLDDQTNKILESHRESSKSGFQKMKYFMQRQISKIRQVFSAQSIEDCRKVAAILRDPDQNKQSLHERLLAEEKEKIVPDIDASIGNEQEDFNCLYTKHLENYSEDNVGKILKNKALKESYKRLKNLKAVIKNAAEECAQSFESEGVCPNKNSDGDCITYTWMSNSFGQWKTDMFTQSPALYKFGYMQKSRSSARRNVYQSKAGGGMYVSLSPFDSRRFAGERGGASSIVRSYYKKERKISRYHKERNSCMSKK
ncbi:MAG: Fic family protein [Oligoflexia bacterium]|nr:Fic family protein [Oligoflexia bacterium]